MEIGIIFWYRLEKRTPKERTKFNRNFLGFQDKSQYGKYTYFREGFITNIPHVRLSNSLFIVQEKDIKDITKFFREYDVTPGTRKVFLTKSDEKVLSK